MGKLIWRGFSKSGDLISPQVAIITGANLRKHSGKPSQTREKEQKKEPKKATKKERR